MTLSHAHSGRFLVYDDGAAFHLVELPIGTSHLGRCSRSILPLDGAGIARRHATVTVDPAGAVEIHDDRSPTGTWVGGERVQRRRLDAGDTVRVGNATLSFLAAGEPINDNLLVA
jgi:pSer/pThr/pTyr-binding forkhead associated (FHA) protein